MAPRASEALLCVETSRRQRYHGVVPELPEVETIRRDLEQRIIGRRITSLRIPADFGKPVPVLKGIDEASFRQGVVGARIEALERRGKYLALRIRQRWGRRVRTRALHLPKSRARSLWFTCV